MARIFFRIFKKILDYYRELYGWHHPTVFVGVAIAFICIFKLYIKQLNEIS